MFHLAVFILLQALGDPIPNDPVTGSLGLNPTGTRV